jgi:hypothetical protein
MFFPFFCIFPSFLLLYSIPFLIFFTVAFTTFWHLAKFFSCRIQEPRYIYVTTNLSGNIKLIDFLYFLNVFMILLKKLINFVHVQKTLFYFKR